MALVLVFAFRSCFTASPIKPVGGTGGIPTSLLFDDTPEDSYPASVLLPAEFAPMNQQLPTVKGTSQQESALMEELVNATRAIENEGYEVGYVLLDVDTGITVSYGANATFYAASSIKGPYVTSVGKYELGDSIASESNLISRILENSDNAAYYSLRNKYGNAAFKRLVEQSGAEQLPAVAATDEMSQTAAYLSGESLSDDFFEFLTPNQMLALWKVCYDYLSSDDPGAAWLASEFELPKTSAIRVSASAFGTTWTKAGWYPGNSSSYGTTVDAGVVRSDGDDFILAVMTTKPQDFAALESIVSPLVILGMALAS